MSRNKKMHREERMIEEISIFWAMLFSLEESTNCRAPTHQNHPFAYQNLKTLFRPYPKMQWRELTFFKFAAKWAKVFSRVTEWSASSRIVSQHHILNYAKIQKTYFIWGPLFDLTMSHTPRFVGITAKRMSYIKLFFFSTFLKLSTMSAEEIGKSDENSFPCTQEVSGW